MQQAQSKILFPCDFSESSLNAWGTVNAFAKMYGAEVILLYIVEPPTIPLDYEKEIDVLRARKFVSDKIQELGMATEVLVTSLVKLGKPYKKILEAALEVNPIYIVMGTHGAEGVQELFIGSNSSRVIRDASCPVITVRFTQKDAVFNRILLPLDLSKETKEKVAKSIEIATKFNASLNLVSVVSSNDNEERAQLRTQLEAVEAFAKNHNLNVESELIENSAEIGKAVIEYAKGKDIDLICIMTQQEKSLKEYFLGSTAEHFVNHSPFPVLSIRPSNLYVSKRMNSIFG